MVEHHAGNLPGRTFGGLVSACSCSCSQPTDRHLALDQLPWSARRRARRPAGAPAKRRSRCAVDPRASRARPTFDHPFPARPDSGSDDQAARRPQRHVEPGPPNVACPRHRRPGSSAVRTARTQRPRTPDSCLSGHLDHTGRVDTGRLDTGRPRDQVDGRPHGGQSDVRRGRRPDILDGHDGGGAGSAAQNRSGCSVCGARQPMTAPR
jgi:hypothetical protein